MTALNEFTRRADEYIEGILALQDEGVGQYDPERVAVEAKYFANEQVELLGQRREYLGWKKRVHFPHGPKKGYVTMRNADGTAQWPQQYGEIEPLHSAY